LDLNLDLKKHGNVPFLTASRTAPPTHRASFFRKKVRIVPNQKTSIFPFLPLLNGQRIIFRYVMVAIEIDKGKRFCFGCFCYGAVRGEKN